MSRAFRALVVAALAALAACSSRSEPACPRIVVPAEGASVTNFREGPGRDLTDVVTTAEFVDVGAQCRYDRRGVSLDLRVAIVATRGPAYLGRSADVTYFVAVADPERNILNKEIFVARFEFPEGRTRVGSVEELEPRIPLADPRRGADYQVVVGFQLTPEQIEWNRKQRGR